MKFSVLMSVYAYDEAPILKVALQSILAQDCLPSQVVLVEDGPLPDSLKQELDAFSEKFPNTTRVALPTQKGLANALKEGIFLCREELIARFDADDINCPGRFSQQLAYFKQHPEISILGGQIDEFIEENGEEKILSHRRVPLAYPKICRFSQKRNPFNHMTVMFRKADILAVGNYQEAQGMEDYYLWLRLLQKGYLGENLADTLVKARVGKGMIKRRGGLRYSCHALQNKYRFWREGLLKTPDFLVSSLASLTIALIPSSLRETIYYQLLHKKS